MQISEGLFNLRKANSMNIINNVFIVRNTSVNCISSVKSITQKGNFPFIIYVQLGLDSYLSGSFNLDSCSEQKFKLDGLNNPFQA